MTETPEANLQNVLQALLGATRRDSGKRQTAVRWFNRLYYDVRKWNESFIAFLRHYPGFDSSTSMAEADYKGFLVQLAEYRDSLEMHYGTVKGDLCSNLKILSARYSLDFKWLHDEDPGAFYQIRRLIDDSYQAEDAIISIAYSVCSFIYDISNDSEWHVRHHGEIVERIREYEEESRRHVASLQEMAESVGIHLLDVAEYEAALRDVGSQNPEIMVIGEVTMSQDTFNVSNVIGPVNIKNRLEKVKQIVTNSAVAASPNSQELAALIEELKESLAVIAKERPEDSERVAQAAEMVASEVSKEKPSKSFLGISIEGLKEAAKAVEDIAPSVINVATKIALLVSGMI